MSRIRMRARSIYHCRFVTVGVFILFVAIGFVETIGAQSAWTPVGPAGGDARAFAAVPGQSNHLYLGTLTSWIYESTDEGGSWHRLAKLDVSDDLVIDNIVVDAANPATVFVGAWKLGQSGGGLWVSHDAGKTWRANAALRGQSIRALTQAPSNPKLLFAGTLEGVFRSGDSGVSWQLISPPGSREIHEIESLAVDPVNPDIIYAGTWHLPWKTRDGGKNWENMKNGIIEDSDVFSIIIDPSNAQTVFLSACSGIYKSESAGQLFKKIAGIPSTARRTRVLMQDPRNHQIVYAGTTEGLYKTTDGGKTFAAMTKSDVIVNDVFVDPNDPNRVLLATDREGVLTSRDGGATFTASNEGISDRKIGALLVDRQNPAHLFAGVLNDKTFGGVFESTDGGAHWQQTGEGLEGRDVFALEQAQDGAIVAGTSSGIFMLENKDASSGTPHWEPKNMIENTVLKPVTETHAGRRINVEKKVKAPVVEIKSRVNALDLHGDVWLASSSVGLLTSKDHGASWQGGPVGGAGDYLSVAGHGSTLVAARSDGLVQSNDGGALWLPMMVPNALTRIHRIAFSADGTLWLGGREGVFFTRDQGKTWMWLERLPFRDVDELSYAAALGRVLVSSRGSDQIFAIDPGTMQWKLFSTGYKNGVVRAAGNRLVVASQFDGVIEEPPAAVAGSGLK